MARDIDGVKKRIHEVIGDRITDSKAARESHGSSEAYQTLRAPDLVAFPESTAEVAAIVRICSDARIPIIPFGAGTSLEGNATAPLGGLCVDLTRMDRVLAINAEDLDVRVQPGITRKKLNGQLRDTGLFFPIDPEAMLRLAE
jgi:D-lactate dehydrogenase (cytochrome)